MSRMTAILTVAMYVCFFIYPMGFAFVGASDQAFVEGTSVTYGIWILLQNQDAKEAKFDKVSKTTKLEIPPNQRIVTNRNVRTYFLNNDVHYNLPLITYKFPRSEQTEAG